MIKLLLNRRSNAQSARLCRKYRSIIAKIYLISFAFGLHSQKHQIGRLIAMEGLNPSMFQLDVEL
jgi:hypothetical protein